MEVIRNSKPIVLEPIVEIEILGPDNAIGDLTGDLSRQARPCHRHRPARRHDLHHRAGTAGRTERLPVAPEVADRRAGRAQPEFQPLRAGAAEQQQLMGQHTTREDDE